MKQKRVASYQNSVLGQAREDENYAQAEEVDLGQKWTQSGEAGGKAKGERRCWSWVGDGRSFDHCDFSLTQEANSSDESEDWGRSVEFHKSHLGVEEGGEQENLQ